MPRPIVSPGASDVVPRLPIEFPMVTVDAPDAYYGAARVQLVDMVTLLVLDRGFTEVGRYTLDEFPQFVAGNVVGSVGGSPLVVTRIHDCGCGTKTTKEVKGAG